jgi:hypothetical protein
MVMFDDREKEFEARFKHEEELRFKITARRNRLLGLWAAERMGIVGDDADAYAKSIVEVIFSGSDPRVIEKLVADLNAKGQPVTAAQIKFELDHFAETAKQQVMNK